MPIFAFSPLASSQVGRRVTPFFRAFRGQKYGSELPLRDIGLPVLGGIWEQPLLHLP